VILLHHSEYRGRGEGEETRGKIRQIEVTQNSLFYCSWVTWCSTRAHIPTSCPLPWYSGITFSCRSFITRCQNAVRLVSPEFRVEAHWLNCALPKCGQASIAWIQGRSSLVKLRRATNVSTMLASRYLLSHDPRTLPPLAAYLQRGVAKQRAQGRNSQREQNGRNLPLRTFIKILSFLFIKPLHLKEACSCGRTWNGGFN